MRKFSHLLTLLLFGFWNIAVGAAGEVFTLQELPNHYRDIAREIAHQLGDPTFRNLLLSKFSEQQVASAARAGEEPPELIVALAPLLKEYQQALTKLSGASSDNPVALTETIALSQVVESLDSNILKLQGLQDLTQDLLSLHLIMGEPAENQTLQQASAVLFSSTDNWDEFLVAYPPPGEDVKKCISTEKNPNPGLSCKKGDKNYRGPTSTFVEAFDQVGRSIKLNKDKKPKEKNVLIVDRDERKEMRSTLWKVNTLLKQQRHKAQKKHGGKGRTTSQATPFFMPISSAFAKNQEASNLYNCLEVQGFARYDIKDVQEPWFKGVPEPYAFINGFCSEESPDENEEGHCLMKKKHMKLLNIRIPAPEDNNYPEGSIPLDFIKGTTNNWTVLNDAPIAIIWSYYDANINDSLSMVVMEKDNTNHKQWIDILVGLAGSIGVPGAALASAVARKIVAQIPDAWLTDDDDLLESFEIIQKVAPNAQGRTYTTLIGTTKNMGITLHDREKIISSGKDRGKSVLPTLCKPRV